MKQFIVDAFTETLFAGNPAAVLPCRQMPQDGLMLSIARENNYSETAFVVRKGPGRYDLKWYTPGGFLKVRLGDDPALGRRVYITGSAVLFMQGDIPFDL